ncbi:MAG: serine/threonine-protein kinase [Sandaracinaceae bacterium]
MGLGDTLSEKDEGPDRFGETLDSKELMLESGEELAMEPTQASVVNPAEHPSFDDVEDDPFGDLSTGAHLGGRYRLEKILGKGATGVVFEASHLVIGKRVALKCLYPHHRAAANAIERFFREARIAATVEHPNVIQVFDGGDEKETLFLAMELLDGESLGDRLERGPLPVDEAVAIFVEIMDGVAAVHERGVVHRDLKPDNVFLVRPVRGQRPHPKVLDFGISKLKEPGLRELTSIGAVMGTPYYMAPEQVANTRGVDVRADVYSLGVMLYEALAGDVPYAADSVLDIFQRHQEGGATPLDMVRTDVPRELAELVRTAMDPEITKRFASVREMRDALASIVLSDDEQADAEGTGQVRMTVRDVMSPLYLAEREAREQAEKKDKDTVDDEDEVISPLHEPSRRRGAETLDVRSTQALKRPPTITPGWVWPTLIAMGVLAFFSFGFAVVALLL